MLRIESSIGALNELPAHALHSHINLGAVARGLSDKSGTLNGPPYCNNERIPAWSDEGLGRNTALDGSSNASDYVRDLITKGVESGVGTLSKADILDAARKQISAIQKS
jgi:hypothetical protein